MKRWGLLLLRRVGLFSALFPLVVAAEITPIVIGGSLGLTGKYEQLALMQKRGFELWQHQINRQGGMLGRPVELILKDDQSDKKQAIEIYRNLLDNKKVDLIFAPYSSGLTNAIMPVVESHNIPLIASGAAANMLWEQGYKNLFGLFLPASRYTVGFLEMIALSGITEITIVTANDLFSQAIADGARKWAEDFGLTVTFQRDFQKGERDLLAVATEIAAYTPKVLIVCGHYNESIDMLKALEKVGYQPPLYFATIGPALEKFQHQLGEQAEGVFSSVQWSSQALHRKEDGELFVQPFIAEYGVEPSYHAAQAYAAGQVLVAAIEENQSLDLDALRKKLSPFHTLNVIGRYGVDATGRQVRHFALNSQWQNGKLEIVWPAELATSQPQLNISQQ